MLRPVGDLDALAVIVHKTAIPVQQGEAVTADAVFFLQEVLCFLRGWISGIHGCNPELSACEAGAVGQHMRDFLIRKRKSRGLCCLCSGEYGFWIRRLCGFLHHTVNGRYLLLLCWEEAQLLGLLCQA